MEICKIKLQHIFLYAFGYRHGGIVLHLHMHTRAPDREWMITPHELLVMDSRASGRIRCGLRNSECCHHGFLTERYLIGDSQVIFASDLE